MQPLTANTLDVTAIACSSGRTQASIFGHTSVNGSGSYEYEIDVKDAGEPGTSDTYRILIPLAPYDSGSHNLGGGNIEIH